jgi:glyoxylase-like metal-dependent hydrolase (beta-lactamase superfamily II)
MAGFDFCKRMAMKNKFYPAILFFFLVACKGSKIKTEAPAYDKALLQQVRASAMAVPGELPQRINYLKYASSIRKWNQVVADGSDDPCTMARTAFQIEYGSGWIMVDAGMDRAVHHFFEKEKPQPFDDTAAARIAQAVQNARLILITHEHGDHVAGAIRNANDQLPPKTILTKEQADALMNNPQMPEIKLDETKSKQYIITSFESVLPVAPGVVLIKAPGHTNGEIMIYTKLQDGREYIFAGDVAWCYKGVAEKKQKPKSERQRLGEDGDLVEQQLNWLNERMVQDKMTILVSHDDIMLPQFAASGLIGNQVRVN